jgi:transcriptional regulator with XRE-family HTH domain
MDEPADFFDLFGARLKALRTEKGWSQRRAAARARISPGYYSMLEGGNKGPAFEMLPNLARAFGVDEADLLCFPGTTDRHDLNDLLRDAPLHVRQEVLAFARERLARHVEGSATPAQEREQTTPRRRASR